MPGEKRRAVEVMIYVKLLTGKHITFGVLPSDTIADVKRAIQDLEGFPPLQQHVIFVGKELEDCRTCREYGIRKDSIVFLVHPRE